MQALKDAVVLLILGVLLISVRITPLQRVDLIPPAEAAEAAQEAPTAAPELNRAASGEPNADGRVFVLSIESEESTGTDCPIRLQTERCRTSDDGRTVCVLDSDGLTRVERGMRTRQRAAHRSVAATIDCT